MRWGPECRDAEHGSGFLVSAPLPAGIVGNLAVICMAGLLLLAYGVGGAIRFNIRLDPVDLLATIAERGRYGRDPVARALSDTRTPFRFSGLPSPARTPIRRSVVKKRR